MIFSSCSSLELKYSISVEMTASVPLVRPAQTGLLVQLLLLNLLVQPVQMDLWVLKALLAE